MTEADDLIARLRKRLEDAASRMNSAYDHYGMNHTAETVDPDIFNAIDLIERLSTVREDALEEAWAAVRDCGGEDDDTIETAMRAIRSLKSPIEDKTDD